MKNELVKFGSGVIYCDLTTEKKTDADGNSVATYKLVKPAKENIVAAVLHGIVGAVSAFLF